MNTVIALLPYTIRAIRWPQIAAGAGSALVFVGAVTLSSVTYGTSTVTTMLRFAALLGAVGVAFLFDDPSESSTSVNPVPQRLRLALRLLVIMPAAALWWVTLLLLLRIDASSMAADTGSETWQTVPLIDVTLEAITLLAIAVALAAVAVRSPPHNGGGVVSAPVLIAIVVIGQLAPRRFGLFPLPGDPQWAHAHRLWMGLLVAALVLLFWATRDLARRSFSIP